MGLTLAETQSFTQAKLDQLARMDAARLDASLTLAPVEGAPAPSKAQKDAHRAKVVGQWANMTATQLRARVNVLSMGSAPTFAPESDYTQDEQDAIAYGYKGNVGRAWGKEIPAILAHKAEMEADGLSAATVKAILKAR